MTAPCPWCGGVEPSEFLLRINHWVRSEEETGYDWCADHQMCIAMSLTRAHVESYARKLRGDRLNDYPTCECHTSYNRDCGQVALTRAIERARVVWAKAGTDWLAEYEALARPLTAPENHPVSASEEVALW